MVQLQLQGSTQKGFLIHEALAFSTELVNLLFPRLDQHPVLSKHCRRKRKTNMRKKNIKTEPNTFYTGTTTTQFPFVEDKLSTSVFIHVIATVTTDTCL